MSYTHEFRETFQTMEDEIWAYLVDKGWEPVNNSHGDLCALLHSEVTEILEAYRDFELEDGTVGLGTKPEGVGAEMADVLIRLLHMARKYDIDLAAEYVRKMEYNRKRPYQHDGRILQANDQ